MHSIANALIPALLATGLIGCAMDLDLEDTADTESALTAADPAAGDTATAPRAWVLPGETVVSRATPAGWKPIELAGAPAGTVLAAPVDEVATLAACPSGFACLYQNSNRGGFRLAVQSGIGVGNLGGIPCSVCTNGIHGNNGTFNNQMSSWENRSGRRYCWWFGTLRSGEVHPMSNNLIVNVLARENDQASSFGPC